MAERFANHLRAYFSDSAFIKNKGNANYVAKSYMMAKKMCEKKKIGTEKNRDGLKCILHKKDIKAV